MEWNYYGIAKASGDILVAAARQQAAANREKPDRPESEESVKPTKHKRTVGFQEETREAEPALGSLTAKPASDVPGPWACRVTGPSQKFVPTKPSLAESNDRDSAAKLLKLSIEDDAELKKVAPMLSK